METPSENKQLTARIADISLANKMDINALQAKLARYNIIIKNDSLSEGPLIVTADTDALNKENFHEMCLSKGGCNSNKIFILLPDLQRAAKKIRNIITGKSTQKYYFAGLDEEEHSFGRLKNFLLRYYKIHSTISLLKVKEKIAGVSAVWKGFIFDTVEAALFSDSHILLSGESGTGKELIANLIYSIYKLNKTGGELVTVDCTTLSRELAGTELFGHEKGAFTNAVYMREGAIELADNGTLFLDEIGELPLDFQSIFLRALQEGTYKRVGGNLYRHSKFRLITATNRDMESEVRNKKFREDLYYRVSGLVLNVPSLKYRKEDILPLSQFFLKKHYKGNYSLEFTNSAADHLTQRDFKGNARELEQLIKRLCFKYTGTGKITEYDIMECEMPLERIQCLSDCADSFNEKIIDCINTGSNLKNIKDMTVNAAIDIAIRSSNGIIKEAARKLGITERAIQKRRNGNTGNQDI